MYKVVLYGESSATGEAVELKLKKAKDVRRDNEGVLVFSDGKNQTIAECSRGSWQYWVELEDEKV